MLLSLSIENFKGFSEPVKILANAEDMKMDENVQPIFCRLNAPSRPFSLRIDNTVAIWGSNLSGKSTIIDALKTIQKIILCKTVDYTPNTFFGSDKPTKFAIEFCRPSDGLYKTFRYEVEYAANGITEEHIYHIDEAAYNPIQDDSCTTFTLKAANGAQDTYLDEIKTLNRLQPKSDPTGASETLHKFAEHMFFVPKNTCAESQELLDIANLPIKQSYHLLQALKFFDPSLVSIQATGKNLEFVHEIAEKRRQKKSFSDEPESFRALANLLGAVESAASREGIVIADDIDSTLHPSILQEVEYLFSLQNFYNLAPMQLIATFTNTTNMDYLQLRRDSIWFLQYTHPYRALFSLAEYKEDQEEFLWLSYLRGRYGWTVPEIPVAFGRDNRI